MFYESFGTLNSMVILIFTFGPSVLRVMGFIEFLERHLEVEQYIAETAGKTGEFHTLFGRLMTAFDVCDSLL